MTASLINTAVAMKNGGGGGGNKVLSSECRVLSQIQMAILAEQIS
jgi:hypothetical protein